MRINNNIMALNAHRQLVANQGSAAKSIEKLSSGLRINRAGDDAAGLAISEKMRGQIKGLSQASRNAQDAISLIQTAEGALNETHSILQRMRELAIQAASDVATDEDRTQMQAEINQLAEEITRISNTTEFNTSNLMAGGFRDKSVLIGSNQGQMIRFSVGAMDAASLGVTSNVVNTSVASGAAGINAATVRDGTNAAAFGGQTIGISSSILSADIAGAVAGSSAAQSISAATAAQVEGITTGNFSAVADATSAAVSGVKVMNTAATYQTAAVDEAGADAIAEGNLAMVVNVNGSNYTLNITVGNGSGEVDTANGNTAGQLATAIQQKLSGQLGESVTVSHDTGGTNTFTFTSGATGSDQSALRIVSVHEDTAGGNGDITSTFTAGAVETAGTGTGSVDGTGYGIVRMSIDGTQFDVNINSGATFDNVLDNINAAANAALGTSGVTYASNDGGAIQISSDTTGANSSVKVLADFQSDGSTAAGGALIRNLGLTTSTTSTQGLSDVGANGTAGSFTMSVNGVSFDVNLTQANAGSLADVATVINTAAKAAGAIGMADTVADASGGSLVLNTDDADESGATTGTNANIVIGEDNSNGRTLAALGLSAGTTTGANATSGSLRLSIDGTEFSVTLGNGDDSNTVATAINTAANTALGTTSQAYATVDAQGRLHVSSLTSGSNSSVGIVGDTSEGRSIAALGLQVGTVSGANTGEMQVTATVGSTSETVTISNNADIVQFSQAFDGLTLTKDAAQNTAVSGQIETSVSQSTSASFTADGRLAAQASVQSGILVDTVDAANVAVTAIDQAINTVSDQRSTLGALQNRLEHTINNLSVSAENLSAAESRIRDLDMAAEMMSFTKSNILNQAATAMLAQANAAPQSVLQLLG